MTDEPGPAGAGGVQPAQRPLRVGPLIVLSVINHVAFAGARVCLTLGALQLQASTFTVGLLLSLLSVLPMILAVPGGRWVDRTGTGWPMMLGTAVMMAGIAAPAAHLHLGGLALACVLIGVGYLPFHLAIQKLISQIGPPEDRRHNLSLMAIGFSVSAFLGPTLSGFLIDGVGHRAAFAAIVLLPLVTLVGLRLLAPRLPRPTPASAQPDSRAASVRDLLATPELRRLYAVVALISSAWEVHQFLVPLYGTSHGLSASKIGLILGAFAIASFLVRLMVPLFLRNISEWTAITVAICVSVLVYLMYPLSGRIDALLLLSFLLGLGLGISQPMTLSVLARTAPPERLGEATGLRLTLVFGTQAALPLAFGALGGLIGVGALFWGMAVVLAAGLPGLVGMARARPSR